MKSLYSSEIYFRNPPAAILTLKILLSFSLKSNPINVKTITAHTESAYLTVTPLKILSISHNQVPLKEKQLSESDA